MAEDAVNGYSPAWVRAFLDSVAQEQTDAEVAFLARQLPLAAFPRVLDLCCGSGRHAVAMARLGYAVTGVERDAALVARARAAAGPGATFVAADVRSLDAVPGTWDAAVVLWASFGLFDAQQNERLLRDVATRLRHGGRLLLDVYHAGFFAGPPVARSFDRGSAPVVERRRTEGDRLHVELDYGAGAAPDRFAWQVFTPDGLAALAARQGFATLLACSGFDESAPASERHARMQVLFEKRVPPPA
jgi:SAM-dependent methyltransferase